MSKIRDLKELVADFGLCNQIPLGEFEDSVFGWRYSPRIGLEPDWEVVPRAGNDVDCPAPTLQEIMEKINPSAFAHASCTLDFGQYTIRYRHYPKEAISSDNFNPSAAALKLWLELNSKKQEKLKNE